MREQILEEERNAAIGYAFKSMRTIKKLLDRRPDGLIVEGVLGILEDTQERLEKDTRRMERLKLLLGRR
jgi:hypothetical protein